jgi:hypothetical protein
MPNWCRATVKKDNKEIVLLDILAGNHNEAIKTMKELYPDYTEEKGYKYESTVIDDGHNEDEKKMLSKEDTEDLMELLTNYSSPEEFDEAIEFMEEMSKRNTSSAFFETSNQKDNIDTCSAMNLEHRIVMISPDKTEEFFEEMKKNTIKPEFLEQCLKFSNMLKKGNKDD